MTNRRDLVVINCPDRSVRLKDQLNCVFQVTEASLFSNLLDTPQAAPQWGGRCHPASTESSQNRYEPKKKHSKTDQVSLYFVLSLSSKHFPTKDVKLFKLTSCIDCLVWRILFSYSSGGTRSGCPSQPQKRGPSCQVNQVSEWWSNHQKNSAII